MRKIICPAAFLVLVFVLTIFISACGGGDGDGGTSPVIITYTVADLAGTWYLNTVNTNNLGNPVNPGNSYYGQMAVSAGGFISSGEYFNYPTGELIFTGGSLSLNRDTGVPSGTILTGSGSFILDSGKMDPSKNAMVFTSHNSLFANQFDLTIAFKGGGSYISSDLNGSTWFLFGLSSRPAGGGAVRGDMVTDNSGGITGNYIVEGGTEHAITGGGIAFILASTPVFAGNFDTDEPVTRSVVNGIMDNSKTFASFIATVSPDGGLTITESETVVMVKQAGNLHNSDLAGTWYISGASAGNIDPNNDGAITGNLVINASGGITGGSITLPGTAASPVAGGSMSVTTAGALTGNIVISGDDINFLHGRLDASKQKMAFTDTTEKRLFILFK